MFFLSPLVETNQLHSHVLCWHLVKLTLRQAVLRKDIGMTESKSVSSSKTEWVNLDRRDCYVLQSFRSDPGSAPEYLTFPNIWLFSISDWACYCQLRSVGKNLRRKRWVPPKSWEALHMLFTKMCPSGCSAHFFWDASGHCVCLSRSSFDIGARHVKIRQALLHVG